MDIEDFPLELDPTEVMEKAYGSELLWILDKLCTQTSTLIECEKQVIPYLYIYLRRELKERGFALHYLDGRAAPDEEGNSPSVLRTMILQITDAVRSCVEQTILILPHLDILVSNSNSDQLTTEARELLPLLYENPNIVFLSFRDPNFQFFKVIENLFPARKSLLGISRGVLPSLITKREARKFPSNFNFYKLYQYVSGLNPIRMRQILSRLGGEDFPESDKKVLGKIREMTISSDCELPQVDLSSDIGGYHSVKEKIKQDILSMMKLRQDLPDETELKEMDALIPKGMIFHGPPGTGKTFFAKAIANSLNATIHIVSGPELKSMWVGQSEANIRSLFFKARKSAPSVIVFDELDSFASSRSSGGTNEVQHSMVNQLLTEMDGFRKEELVFVIGTTNFVSSLDPALLRPGRFELKIEIPLPGLKDRAEILALYNKKLALHLDQSQLDFIAAKTGEITDPMTGSPFTGDHLYSVMRYLKRLSIREKIQSFDKSHLFEALRGGPKQKKLTEREKKVVSIHEAGHAVVALSVKESTPVERISIDSDFAESLGFTEQQKHPDQFVITKRQLLADMMILFGGREAELMVFNDNSIGSENDLQRANYICKEMVEHLGMTDGMGVWSRLSGCSYSEFLQQRRDKICLEMLEASRRKCREILEARRDLVERIAEVLLAEKTINRERLESILSERST